MAPWWDARPAGRASLGAGEAVVDDGLLDAPELGPVADTLTLYQAIESSAAPIGKQSIVTVAGAAMHPHAALIAIQVPINDNCST